MKRIKLTLVLVIVGLLLLTTSLQALALDCTALGAGKDATVDGSTLVTINQDVPSYDFRLWYKPAKYHAPGAMRPCPDYPQLQRWFDVKGNPIDADNIYLPYDQREPNPKQAEKFEIPEVPHTYALFYDTFGVMNENQVCFSMPTLHATQALWNDQGMLRITQLSIIAGERARTAREAIQIMGELAEEYGFRGEYTPGKNLIVGDPNEVWVFNIMQAGPFWTPESDKPGAIWAAQRIPDDHVCVLPNGFPIQDFDFDDPDNFMYCDHLQSFAEEMGWYDPKSDIPFSLAEVYMEGQPESMGVLTRKFGGYRLIAPSLELPDPYEAYNMKDKYGRQYRYPFSVKPDKKVSIADFWKVMYSKLEGTRFDLTKGPLAGPHGNPFRMMGTNFTTDEGKVAEATAIGSNPGYTQIIQMRSWLPNYIGGIIWWAPGRPFATFLTPFYCGITEVSETHSTGNHYEVGEWGENAFWAISLVDLLTYVAYNDVIKDVHEKQSEMLNNSLAQIQRIDREAAKLYKSDPEKAREFLTEFSNQFAKYLTKEYWDFAKELMVKYRYGAINKPEILGYGTGGNPSMPDKDYWLKQALEYQEEVRGLKLE